MGHRHRRGAATSSSRNRSAQDCSMRILLGPDPRPVDPQLFGDHPGPAFSDRRQEMFHPRVVDQKVRGFLPVHVPQGKW